MTETALTESPLAPADVEAIAAAQTPGERLARARIAYGLSLEGVAQQLKFSPRQIEALEANRYAELPGSTMVRGMVRSYARLVHVDAGPLLEALKESIAAPDADRIVARYREPVPFSDVSKRSNVVYVVFTIAALAGAALVLVQWRADRPAPARMTFVPAAQVPLDAGQTAVASAGTSVSARPADAAAAGAGAVPAAADPAPAPAPAASPTPAAGDPASAASLTPATADPAPAAPGGPGEVASSTAETAAASASEPANADAGTETTALAAAGPSDSAAAPRVAPPSRSEHRVALHFVQDAWVEVRDRDGKILVSKIGTAGSDASIESDGPLSFVIGNAQFVGVIYDDRSVDLEPYIRGAVARFTLK